jgi:hypothetical protein
MTSRERRAQDIQSAAGGGSADGTVRIRRAMRAIRSSALIVLACAAATLRAGRAAALLVDPSALTAEQRVNAIVAESRPRHREFANPHAECRLIFGGATFVPRRARRRVGVTGFSDRLREDMLIERGIGDEPLQAIVLVLELAESAELTHAQVGVLSSSRRRTWPRSAPNCRHTSATAVPLSTWRNASVMCPSLNFDRFNWRLSS